MGPLSSKVVPPVEHIGGLHLIALLHTQPESRDLRAQCIAQNLERVRLTSLSYGSRKLSCQICACDMVS